MKNPQNWIVTADSRRAALYSCRNNPDGSLQLLHFKSIDNAHENEHGHERPVLAGGAERRGSVASSGAHAAPHAISVGHEKEEEQRRFAREVAAWIGDVGRYGAAHRIALFAPARVLGLLRKELAGLGEFLQFHEGDIAQMSPRELAVHPLVRKACAVV